VMCGVWCDSQQLLGAVDPSLTKHFHEAEDNGVMERSMYILMGDHGIAYGTHFMDFASGCV